MRPYVRRYLFEGNLTGSRIRNLCDGTSVVTSLQVSPPRTGLHKRAAVKSDGFYATDYSATWIKSHSPATAKWRDNSSVVICYDQVGVGPGPLFNPIYKTRPLYAQNILPVSSMSMPLSYITARSFSLTNGDAMANTRFYGVKDDMTNEFLLKIKDQKAMSLVTIAESAQTASLVRSLSKDVADALLFVARGILKPKTLVDAYLNYARKNGLRDPSKARYMKSNERKFVKRMQRYYKKHPVQHAKLLNGIPNTAAERWVQYRYGIGPLVGDFQAAHDYVYTKWHKFIHFNRIVVKYKEGRTNKVGSNDILQGVIFIGESNAKCQYISRFVIRNQVARHATKTGFSPAELLATAWELTPWSFIVDWAYGLGDYFNALSATVGLTHLQTSFSIKEEVKCVTKVTLDSRTGQIERPYGPDGAVEYGAFVRETYAKFPVPVAPSIKFPFDSIIDKRLFDSLALLKVGFNSKQLSNRGA